MKVLRFMHHGGQSSPFTAPEKRDGELIALFTDVYQCGFAREAVSGIHAAGGKILAYLNFNAGKDKPDSWKLLDQYGAPLSSTTWPQNHAMDKMNPDFRAYLVDYVKDALADGLDGVWADNGFSPRFPDDFQFSQRAIDERTRDPYTDEQYIRDSVDLLNYVQRETGAMIISNGFWNGNRYELYKEAFDYGFRNINIAGLFSEGMFTKLNGEAHPPNIWMKSINFIESIQSLWLARGKSFVTYSMGKNTASFYGISLYKAGAFIYASLLMGANRDGNLVSAHNGMRDPDLQELFKLEIGEPEGIAMLQSDGSFKREFTRMTVTVNNQTLETTFTPKDAPHDPPGTFPEEIKILIAGTIVLSLVKKK